MWEWIWWRVLEERERTHGVDGLKFEGSDINFGGQPTNHLFCLWIFRIKCDESHESEASGNTWPILGTLVQPVYSWCNGNVLFSLVFSNLIHVAGFHWRPWQMDFNGPSLVQTILMLHLLLHNFLPPSPWGQPSSRWLEASASLRPLHPNSLSSAWSSHMEDLGSISLFLTMPEIRSFLTLLTGLPVSASMPGT